MRKISYFLLIFLSAIMVNCNHGNDEVVNLIAPSGQLLARNTMEIKELVKSFNSDIKNIDSLRISKITYDEADSQTIAKIYYSYNNQPHSAMIYINTPKDSNYNNEKTLLENSKMTVITQPNKPVVIILTSKDSVDTLRMSSKYKNM